MIAVNRVHDLPQDIDVLAREARADGYGFIDRLIDDFRRAQNTFSLPGEALFEARSDGALAGVGGINVDPHGASGATGRIRRLYVRSEQRGVGVGRSLMKAIESHARATFAELRLHTDNPDAASFYESLGYKAVADVPRITHVKRLRG